MKILELFSGYGTSSFALKRLGIPYELIGFSDIDKYANKVFMQNHCKNGEENKQLGDIKGIIAENLPDFDLLTGGFPCQAFSVAGKGLGELDPRGTLFYEIIRIAEVKKPRYMLLENVKGLTNKNHKPTFDKILSELERIGYKVHWKVLNTKDYGIPQNRERVWFVCFKNGEVDTGKFHFPEKEELKIFIKDILEPIVNLQPRQGKGVGGKGIISKNDGTTYCLDQNNGQGIVITRNGYETDMSKPEIGEANRIYGINGVSPPVKASQLKIYDRKGFDSRDKFRESELSPTLSTKMGTGGNNVPMVVDAYNNTIPKDQNVSTTIRTNWANGNAQVKTGQLRRLTPKECFRLQGFLNDEVNLEGISDTQKYKLAGNGQSVNVVAKIFERILK